MRPRERPAGTTPPTARKAAKRVRAVGAAILVCILALLGGAVVIHWPGHSESPTWTYEHKRRAVSEQEAERERLRLPPIPWHEGWGIKDYPELKVAEYDLSKLFQTKHPGKELHFYGMSTDEDTLLVSYGSERTRAASLKHPIPRTL